MRTKSVVPCNPLPFQLTRQGGLCRVEWVLSATGGADKMMVPILDVSMKKGEGQVALRDLANIQDAQLNLNFR